MSNTKTLLKTLDENLNESIGMRSQDHRAVLSPVARPKDVGRRANRAFGKIDIKRVCPDPNQPRIEFEKEALMQLSNSIRAKGQLAPIRVRWSEELSMWLIISGERRWRACKKAGLKTIDCNFEEQPLSQTQILEEQLIENLLRANLKPVEEAHSFRKLIELNGWTGNQLAMALSISPTRVSRALALLKLPDETRARIDSGKISARAGYELSRLSKSKQQEIANEPEVTIKSAVSARKRPKRTRKPKGKNLTFLCENGWKIVASNQSGKNYHELEEALKESLEEVQLRISNRVSM